MTNHHQLSPWSQAGWTGWDDTVRTAAACGVTEWMWTDLRGLQHADSLPPDAPITGCLWGWAAGRSWVRLRVDVPLGGQPQVCGAVLTAGGGTGDPVTVLTADDVPVFRPRHLRGSGAAVLDGRTVRCLRVVDRPLTFVELR